jgi:hypothetical protein
MSTNLYKFTKAQAREVCACPAVGERLYDYIVDLLEDPVAEEVEDHLLNCRCCRQEYLKLLSLRGAKGEPETKHDDGDAGAPNDKNVFSLAGFRKEPA